MFQSLEGNRIRRALGRPSPFKNRKRTRPCSPGVSAPRAEIGRALREGGGGERAALRSHLEPRTCHRGKTRASQSGGRTGWGDRLRQQPSLYPAPAPSGPRVPSPSGAARWRGSASPTVAGRCSGECGPEGHEPQGDLPGRAAVSRLVPPAARCGSPGPAGPRGTAAPRFLRGSAGVGRMGTAGQRSPGEGN